MALVTPFYWSLNVGWTPFSEVTRNVPSSVNNIDILNNIDRASWFLNKERAMALASTGTGQAPAKAGVDDFQVGSIMDQINERNTRESLARDPIMPGFDPLTH